VQNPKLTLNWAKTLLFAACFAFITNLLPALADSAAPAAGLADATRAAEELAPHQKVRLIVYRTSAGSSQAAAFFEVGGLTFRYSQEAGSRYVTARLNDTPEGLASAWCRQPATFAVERRILAASATGQCANGCLIDSLIHYYHLPSAMPEANWEGIFLVFAGPSEIAGDHAVLIYLRGDIGWVYDPCGCRTTCLGKIDLNRPKQLVESTRPDAMKGGWLVSRDLAWLRRHGAALN